MKRENFGYDWHFGAEADIALSRAKARPRDGVFNDFACHFMDQIWRNLLMSRQDQPKKPARAGGLALARRLRLDSGQVSPINVGKTAMRVSRSVAFGLICTALSVGAAFAEGHSDKDDIAKVLKAYETFVNQSDAAGVGALYTDEAILFPDRFDAFYGREAIAGFYAFAFSALTLDIEFVIDPDRIRVSGDTAYATTTSSGTRVIKQTDQTVPEINRELWVFERVSGVWKIARYAFNRSE